MTKNISSRDWETLSAYLDGYLSQNERQRLEERLRRSVELKAGLEELRRTRQILRSQPKMRAPRNFTLTAEMVGAKGSERQGSRIFPVMRFASVLASILLILVVVGDLLTVSSFRTAQMDTAREGVALTAPSEPLAGAAQLAPTEEIEAPAAASEASEAEAATEKAFAPEPTPTGPMMMMAAPTAVAEATQIEPPAVLAEPAGGGGKPPENQALDSTLAIAPTETPPPALALAPAPTEAPAAPTSPNRSAWRIAEVLLALIAIASGLVAYYLRRVVAR